jgi:hypothetical protein
MIRVVVGGEVHMSFDEERETILNQMMGLAYFMNVLLLLMIGATLNEQLQVLNMQLGDEPISLHRVPSMPSHNNDLIRQGNKCWYELHARVKCIGSCQV